MSNMSELTGGVKRFQYSEEVLAELGSSLSPERLSTYLRAVSDGDTEQGVRLYVWNIALSSAFYGVLQGLEVALRNAMHKRLSVAYGRAWYENRRVGLDDGCMERVQSVKKGLVRSDGKRVPPAQMVAGLSFGFWVALLGKGGWNSEWNRKANYEMSLWRPALRHAFPHRRIMNRKQAHAALDQLRILRNRIAHHEPIFNRDLRDDYRQILEVTGWISPTTSEWLDRHSRVQAILDARWDSGELAF